MPFLCLTVTALTPGLGARMAGKLLSAIGSSDRTFNASLTALESHCLNRPRNGCKSSAQPLSWDEPEYPQRLREIYDPPPLPYVRGNIELLDRHPISVVVRDVRPPRGIKWQNVRQRIWPIAGWARFPARRIFRFAIASSRDVAGCGGRRRCAITGSLITARLAMEFWPRSLLPCRETRHNPPALAESVDQTGRQAGHRLGRRDRRAADFRPCRTIARRNRHERERCSSRRVWLRPNGPCTIFLQNRNLATWTSESNVLA
jgi:hypothetical protein